MTSTTVMPGGRDADATAIDRLPGVVFQLHRSHDGRLHFPFLAGGGVRLIGIAPERLAEDARPALDRLVEEDYPRLMAALERSMRWKTPVSTRFRLPLKGRGVRWIALRAQPTPADDGVLWHGMLMDISEQVAEEARLRRLSDTDDLTGVANRRRLMAPTGRRRRGRGGRRRRPVRLWRCAGSWRRLPRSRRRHDGVLWRRG